jgi:hypothetical protein
LRKQIEIITVFSLFSKKLLQAVKNISLQISAGRRGFSGSIIPRIHAPVNSFEKPLGTCV